MQVSLDQNTAILTDLSKALNCLPHDLIASCYDCNFPSLKFFNSYLHSRHQRVNINNFCSS